MNLNSTMFHIEVAKLGKGYIVKSAVSHVPGNGGTSTSYAGQGGEMYFKSPEEFMAWLANLECLVR